MNPTEQHLHDSTRRAYRISIRNAGIAARLFPVLAIGCWLLGCLVADAARRAGTAAVDATFAAGMLATCACGLQLMAIDAGRARLQLQQALAAFDRYCTVCS